MWVRESRTTRKAWREAPAASVDNSAGQGMPARCAMATKHKRAGPPNS